MKKDIASRIGELKELEDAVILAHSYQPPEIQDIADHVGDSLQLSRTAASTKASVIVFCGVRFMAETAHILSPEKKVLLPEPDAGCPLADSITAPELRKMQEEHPQALTVLYVNSPAEAKAESYACCTSANALQVVENVPSDEVIFAPDRNLGTFISRRTSKQVHVWDGACICHAAADLNDVRAKRRDWPDADLLVHPETPPEMWDLADAVLGTGGMIRYVRESEETRFLIGTEEGMVYKLETLFPDREFKACGSIHCVNMKKISLKKVLRCLKDLTPEVRLDPALRQRALKAVERMTEYTG
ncbi:MAG: quinolinate synthase NadA [Candidatus Aegiribacteria sp.]|nr:quinolinate synthase NadA [Candidatus Aegiribacteria sp.]MBD3294483.1 quinolinate synthase NadA [Candidatus Fermentibacteria bacterium]